MFVFNLKFSTACPEIILKLHNDALLYYKNINLFYCMVPVKCAPILLAVCLYVFVFFFNVPIPYR